jgi:hypothetical protein
MCIWTVRYLSDTDFVALFRAIHNFIVVPWPDIILKSSCIVTSEKINQLVLFDVLQQSWKVL